MALQKTPQGKPPAFDRSVFTDSFVSIGGTSGSKPALCRKSRRNIALVESDKMQKNSFHSGGLLKDSRPLGQSQITLRQLVERRLHGLAARHYNDIPAGQKAFLIQAVNLPDPSAGPVANVGLSQFLADGDTHPVAARSVAPGIQNQITVRHTLGVVKPLEYVIKFQTTGILHTLIPNINSIAKLFFGTGEKTDCHWAARDFGTSQNSDPKECFVHFEGLNCRIGSKDPQNQRQGIFEPTPT
jgi:hypothetical protein